jgi:capsular polysaccharide biosynthesis protein
MAMTMLETYNPQHPVLYEENGQALDLAYIIGVLKRRVFYFAIPFFLIVMLGFVIVAIQRPIYRSGGKILVESAEISPDLVPTTVTTVADERIQVIEQRIMTRDNLLTVANKYNLFPRDRGRMGAGLVDLMRHRIEIKPVATETQRPHTIALTLTFDYEDPNLAMIVASEFLTSILSADAGIRNVDTAGTATLLEREVDRLKAEHDSIVAQLGAIKQQPPDREQVVPEEFKAQMRALADFQAELVQKQSIYSDEYPDVKNLKKKIAALKRVIATPPQTTLATGQAPSVDVAAEVLKRQEADLEKSLEDASHKLAAARLGESMERGQQTERLQIIEQPSLPQEPIRPKRRLWFAVAFALAGMIGAGSVFAAEMLDRSIRGSRELAGIIDRHLIVTIPYLSTSGEIYRKRRNLILQCIGSVAIIVVAIAVAVMEGVSVDFSWFDGSRMDFLTHLLP